MKDPGDILGEIRQLITARLAITRARVDGKLFFLADSFSEESARDHSPIIWILRAHVGTLEKLNSLFAFDSLPNTFEALAIARNLFENLVWLRLFNANPQFGLVFYEQLLTQQRDSIERFIRKIEGEIAFFEECQRFEATNFEKIYSSLDPSGSEEQRKEQVKAAKQAHAELTKELDEKVRRSFALYSHAATVNGYSFQCHLLREKAIPTNQCTLEVLNERLARYRACKGKLIDAKLQSLSRWNWKKQSKEVGMLSQYEFLYSFTSKLLHSTPMNVITEKELSPSEMLTMLDYCYVTIADILDAIEMFTFPGSLDVAIIEID